MRRLVWGPACKPYQTPQFYGTAVVTAWGLAPRPTTSSDVRVAISASCGETHPAMLALLVHPSRVLERALSDAGVSKWHAACALGTNIRISGGASELHAAPRRVLERMAVDFFSCGMSSRLCAVGESIAEDRMHRLLQHHRNNTSSVDCRRRRRLVRAAVRSVAALSLKLAVYHLHRKPSAATVSVIATVMSCRASHLLGLASDEALAVVVAACADIGHRDLAVRAAHYCSEQRRKEGRGAPDHNNDIVSNIACAYLRHGQLVQERRLRRELRRLTEPNNGVVVERRCSGTTDAVLALFTHRSLRRQYEKKKSN
eukprot:PhM_4_TR19067/c0_g1_i1/m.15356